jgi:hypothetical protein
MAIKQYNEQRLHETGRAKATQSKRFCQIGRSPLPRHVT